VANGEVLLHYTFMVARLISVRLIEVTSCCNVTVGLISLPVDNVEYNTGCVVCT